MKNITVSIIVVSFNTKEITKNCLDSIYEHFKGNNFEVIVVDNASEDGSIDLINKYNKNHFTGIFSNKNLGFGTANNIGVQKAKGEYVLLINSDTVVKNDILTEMVDWMKKNKNVGVMSCSLQNKDGSVQGTGGFFPTLPRVFSWMTIQDLPFVDFFIKPFHPMKEKSFFSGKSFYKFQKELDWVTGAFMMIPKRIFQQVGGFDEDYFMYTEEVDLCYRIKKLGYKIFYCPQWSIVHLGGASGRVGENIISEFEGVKLFYKKHYSNWKYQILTFILKIGSILRILAYLILNDKKSAVVYKKALYEI